MYLLFRGKVQSSSRESGRGAGEGSELGPVHQGHWVVLSSTSKSDTQAGSTEFSHLDSFYVLRKQA